MDKLCAKLMYLFAKVGYDSNQATFFYCMHNDEQVNEMIKKLEKQIKEQNKNKEN